MKRLALWRGRLPTSLGSKLVAILTGIGVIAGAAVALLLALVITPSFDRLERRAVDDQVDRTHAVLSEFAARVEVSARDYGDWTASYDYMRAPTLAFEDESLSTSAMADLSVNGTVFLRTDGSVAGARWIDLARGVDDPAMRAELLATIRGLDLEKVRDKRSSASFYATLRGQVAAIGVAQVRRTDGGGIPRGYAIMARLISAQELSRMLQLPAAIDAAPQGRVSIDRRGSEIAVAVPVAGADGAAVASVRYVLPRDVWSLGSSMLMLAVIGTMLLLVVVMAVLSWMVARLVLRPLNRLERHMGLVRASGDLEPFRASPRQDEIGRLVGSFNAMLNQLKDLREQVESQSFTLGKTDSAVAMMHNVRNALNPISTVLSQPAPMTSQVDHELLERAVAELSEDGLPLVRRQKLAAFLLAFLESEAVTRERRKERIAICRDAMRNVLEIIGDQQAAAHERPPLESCDVSALLARNATIARYASSSSIAFHFPAKPCWVIANRVLLSQVIGNLFANAAEAIVATGRDGGSIAVSVHQRADRVEVVILDDGEGFDPADAPKLFQRGFSTRPNKRGGLGLHWCANTVAAMGGNLSLKSEGRGKGARAIISMQPAQTMLAASAA